MLTIDLAPRLNCCGLRRAGCIKYRLCPVYQELCTGNLEREMDIRKHLQRSRDSDRRPKEGFAGHYHVRYFYDSGEFSDEYDLVIEKTKDVYKASWITKGKVAAVGVGMEVENGLAIGWRRVAD